jgi:uncharacterized membrane protein
MKKKTIENHLRVRVDHDIAEQMRPGSMWQVKDVHLDLNGYVHVVELERFNKDE